MELTEDRGCGIYRITGPEGRVYIGSTKHFRNRLKNHIWNLNNNKQRSVLMQHDWNTFGQNCFAFEILEYCDNAEERLAKEQYYLSRLFEELPRDTIYNISTTVGFYSSKGVRNSKKSRIKTEFECNLLHRGALRYLENKQSI